MQLMSNDSRKEDVSEREPILCQSDISLQSEESTSSTEITAVGEEPVVAGENLQNLNVDETCHLVNVDQPQCRICLDVGGLDYLSHLVPFIFHVFLSPFEMVDFCFVGFEKVEKVFDDKSHIPVTACAHAHGHVSLCVCVCLCMFV